MLNPTAPDARTVTGQVEHRTVSRVMSILELVIGNEPGGLRLADLASLMDAPKSSIHGLARGLVATGYLRDDEGRYVQGAALSGLLSTGGPQMPTTYRRTLEELSREWNETAVIATVAGDSVINLDAVESNSVVRAHPPLRTRRPMWPGSYGKCFLAFMEPTRRTAFINRNFKDADERAAVLAELDEVRENRIAHNEGATNAQLFGIASPIFAADGKSVSYAIGIAAPIERIPKDLKPMSDSIRAAAAALSFGGNRN